MLLVLRQTVDSTDVNNPLAVNNGWIQMGAYPEFIYNHEYDRDLHVEFELTEFRLRRGQPELPDKLHLKAVFCYNRKTTQIQLKQTEIALDNGLRERIARGQKGKKYSLDFKYLEKGERKRWHREDVEPIKFYDFLLTLKRGEKEKDLIKSLPPSKHFLTTARIIQTELRKIFYLGPLREFPKRFYVTSGQAPQDVGTRGERAVDVLWFSRRSQSTVIRRVEEEVRTWCRKFGIAKNVRLARVGRGNYYRVLITDPASKLEINLADVGFGASQTLPIIIESFYAPKGSVILIEQPEIHLHPKAQSVLGDLFIAAATDQADRTFIIETHSEHILARVRRRIAQRKIKKQDVAIYYFEPTPRGTRIREVVLNDQGQYESFPRGFFEEDLVEAFAHLKAMKRHASK